MVAVNVLVGAAKRALARDPAEAAEILDRAQTAAEYALAELRGVVRSILPPVLTERRNVLLPEPDGPITAVKVPRGTAIETLSSARTALSPVPYTLLTDSSRTANDVLSGARMVTLNPLVEGIGTVTDSRFAQWVQSVTRTGVSRYSLLYERSEQHHRDHNDGGEIGVPPDCHGG
jgi:hypothetical protein